MSGNHPWPTVKYVSTAFRDWQINKSYLVQVVVLANQHLQLALNVENLLLGHLELG